MDTRGRSIVFQQWVIYKFEEMNQKLSNLTRNLTSRIDAIEKHIINQENINKAVCIPFLAPTLLNDEHDTIFKRENNSASTIQNLVEPFDEPQFRIAGEDYREEEPGDQTNYQQEPNSSSSICFKDQLPCFEDQQTKEHQCSIMDISSESFQKHDQYTIVNSPSGIIKEVPQNAVPFDFQHRLSHFSIHESLVSLECDKAIRFYWQNPNENHFPHNDVEVLDQSFVYDPGGFDDILIQVLYALVPESKVCTSMTRKAEITLKSEKIHLPKITLDTGANSGSYIGGKVIQGLSDIVRVPCLHKTRLIVGDTQISPTERVIFPMCLYTNDGSLHEVVQTSFHDVEERGDKAIVGLPDILFGYFEFFMKVIKQAKTTGSSGAAFTSPLTSLGNCNRIYLREIIW